MRNIVVLPQPEGPSNATNSPCFSSALKSMYEAFPAAEARRLVEPLRMALHVQALQWSAED